MEVNSVFSENAVLKFWNSHLGVLYLSVCQYEHTTCRHRAYRSKQNITWTLYFQSSYKVHNNKNDILLIIGDENVTNIAILLIVLLSSEKVCFILMREKSSGASATKIKVTLVLSVHDSEEWLKQWTRTGVRDQWYLSLFAALSDVTTFQYSEVSRQAFSFCIWPLLLRKI